MKRKSPILAAILNLILPGVGYLYVGSRIIFAVMLFIGYLLAIFATWSKDFGGLELMAGGIVTVAFAIDAWYEATNHNKSVT